MTLEGYFCHWAKHITIAMAQPVDTKDNFKRMFKNV